MGWSTGGGIGLQAGSTTLHGLEDYADTATAGAPIQLVVADTWYTLTNDGLGANTQSALKLPGIKNIWNTSTNQFEFDDLTIGDGVLLRTDVNVVASGANRAFELGLRLAANSGTPFVLNMGRVSFKTAGTYQFIMPYWFYIGSALVLNNGAEVVCRSDSTGDSVVVNGWAIRTEPRTI